MHLSQLTFIRTFSTIFWSSKFFLPPILTIVAWPPSAYSMDRSWALVSNLSADSRTCLLPSETVRGASRPPVSVFAPSETLHRTLPSKDLTVIPATSSYHIPPRSAQLRNHRERDLPPGPVLRLWLWRTPFIPRVSAPYFDHKFLLLSSFNVCLHALSTFHLRKRFSDWPKS